MLKYIDFTEIRRCISAFLAVVLVFSMFVNPRATLNTMGADSKTENKVIYDFESDEMPSGILAWSTTASLTKDADKVINGKQSLLYTFSNPWPSLAIKSSRGDFVGDGLELDIKNNTQASWVEIIMENESGVERSVRVSSYTVPNGKITINYADFNLTEEDIVDIVGLYFTFNKSDSKTEYFVVDDDSAEGERAGGFGSTNK